MCYNCDEPFVRGDQCKRLLYLESRDFLDDEGATVAKETADTTDATVDAMANPLVVSLHALASIPVENSLVVYVTINGERLLAHLDTGSTHSFLQGATMQHLDLMASSGN